MPPATPGATPGKGKRERNYVMFNDNPRVRGTHTGKLMPTDVPLNADGFEDPAAFMNSPTVTENLTDSTSRRTTMGAPSSAGTSRRTTIGRMSQLDDGSDEDEFNIGPDTGLVEEDFDAANSTFFGISNPTRVPLPRRSELAPATPGTNVDDLPSPSVSISRSATKSVSKRKSNLGASPTQTVSRRSIATTINRSPLGDRSLDFDDDDMPLNHDDDDANVSPRSRKQSRRDTMATDNTGESSIDASRHRNDRKSMASRKSFAEDQSLDDIGGDEDDQGPEQSYEFDNGPMDHGEDDHGPISDRGDGEDKDEEDLQAEEELAEAEIALEDEQDPVEDSDEDTGSETAVERTQPRPKKAKATKTTKTKPIRRQREDSDSSDTSPVKRARISGFPLVPEEESDQRYKGDFRCRRSGRSHIKPLKWWLGDHLEYQPGEHSAEVKEIVRMSEDVKSLVKKRTYRKTSKRPRESTDLDDGTGHDNETLNFAVVMDYATGEEVDNKRIALPHRQLEPQRVRDGDFEYQKVFGEDTFAAAGVIRIPVGKKKPGKPSKDNAFFFFVHKGGLNVNIHRTSFNMGPGAMFMVPRGNKYSIENLSQVEAELFFAQARKAVSREEEEQILQRNEIAHSETPSTVRPKGNKTKSKSIEPETEAESTQASKKKKKSGKK